MTKVETIHRITKIMYLIHFGKFLDSLTGYEKPYMLVGVSRKQGSDSSSYNVQKWESNPSANLSLRFLLQ